MKTDSYWEQRASERTLFYHKNSFETIKKVNTAYDKALEDILNDINKIFYTFAKKEEISLEDAKKILSSPVSDSELSNIRDKIKTIPDSKSKRSILAKLRNNAKAYKARITRLEALKESIDINIKSVASIETQLTTLGLVNNINQAYYRTIFDIQKGVGLEFNFSQMPVQTIEEILRNNWSGKYYVDRIGKNADVLASKLQDTLLSGISSGKSYSKMAKELDSALDIGKFSAKRLIATETTYVTNMAELESYKECDIDKYVFVAKLDLTTSLICREHDGKVYAVTEGVTGKTLPPLHVFCRSTTIAYFGDDVLSNMQRRATDSDTGKTYVLPQYMNYKEWYQKYVKK